MLRRAGLPADADQGGLGFIYRLVEGGADGGDDASCKGSFGEVKVYEMIDATACAAGTGACLREDLDEVRQAMA